MTNPLVSSDRLAMLAQRPLLALEHEQCDCRDTEPHMHPEGQVFGSRGGLISVATTTNWFVIPASHAIWIPPHLEHALKSHGPFRGWAVYVAERLCPPLPMGPQIFKPTALMDEAVSRAASWGGPANTPAEERISEIILDELAVARSEPLSLPRPQDGRLRRIADALLADPADQRGFEAWAAWAAMPSRTLSRRFKAETGLTLTLWRQRAKVLTATERLTRGEAVTTIALDLGYDSVSAFISMFRRTLGVTPGQYCSNTGRRTAD